MSDRQDPSDLPNAPPAPELTEEISRALWRVLSERVLRKTLKLTIVLALVVYFAVGATALLMRFAVMPRLDALRPRIEAAASAALHAQVSIDRLSARWQGFAPSLDLYGLSVRDQAGVVALTVPHAHAVLAWRSFIHLAPIFASLQIDNPTVQAIRRADGHIEVAGITLRTSGQHNDALAHWLLTQGGLTIHGGTLSWHDETLAQPELTLKNIKLAVFNFGHSHRVGLQADGDGVLLQGPLDLRMRFRHGVLADPGVPAGWLGRAYLSTGALDLAVLGHYVPLPIQASAGQVGATLTLEFSQLKIDSVQGELAGQGLSLRINPQLPELNSPNASLQFTLQRDDQQYRLAVRNLSMALSETTPLADGTPLDRLLNVSQLDATYRPAAIGLGQAFSLHGDQVDVGLLVAFSRKLPLPRTLAEQLERYDPRGVLRDYTVQWARAAPANNAELNDAQLSRSVPIVSYRLKAALEGISVAAQPSPPGLTPLGHRRLGQPGFDNLSGQIDANEKRGALTLAAQHGSVTVQGLFDQPQVDFDTLNGQLDWTLGKNGAQRTIELHTRNLALTNADATVVTDATYRKVDSGRGTLNLLARFPQMNVAAVPRYLPSSMNPKVRTYLAHALRGGTAADATIEVNGQLEYFPFSHPGQPGEFHIVAPFQNGSYDITPVPAPLTADGRAQQWPVFDGVAGRFELNREKLSFSVDRGHYRQFNVSDVEGRIADVGTRDNDLTIDAHGAGPLPDVLAFLASSPASVSSARVLEKISGAGQTSLALKLDVPRDGHKERTEISGAFDLMDDTLRYGDAPPLTALVGKLAFTRHTLELQQLNGRFLGEPVHFAGGVNNDGALAVDIHGNMSSDALRAELPEGIAGALAKRISGSAAYSVAVRAAPHASAAITASADLADVALDLPAPLGKSAGTPMPLRVSLQPLAAAVPSPGAARRGKTERAGQTVAPKDTELPILNHAALERLDAQWGPLSLAYLLRNGAATTGAAGTAGTEPPGSRLAVVQGALGINKTVPLPAQGVALDANLEQLDLDAWRSVLGSLSASGSRAANEAATVQASADNGAINGFAPTVFRTHIGSLELGGRSWTNLALDGSRQNGQIQADLQADQVSGHVTWRAHSPRSPAGELQARMTRLHIPAARPGEPPVHEARQQPQRFPAIDVVADDFTLGPRNLGRLELQARNLIQDGEPVWQLDLLKISNPAATLITTGSWRAAPGDAPVLAAKPASVVSVLPPATPAASPSTTGAPAAPAAANMAGTDGAAAAASGAAVPSADNAPAAADPRRTELDFTLEVADGGALLNRLGLPRTLAQGNGALNGHIGWRGGPDGIDTSTLAGRMSADLRRGQLLKVEPGIAKLLGVLSLQSLARFLTLDFRGIFGAGLSFDSITTNSVVEHGIVHIQDFKLSSSPAKISMSGTADIPHETQNLRVTVVPTLSASSAALAATAINPVLGLGTFVAQLVVSDPLARALTIEYAVTGSWAAPQIHKVKDREHMFVDPFTADRQSNGAPSAASVPGETH
jgi:uncharacterized protein YhdP